MEDYPYANIEIYVVFLEIVRLANKFLYMRSYLEVVINNMKDEELEKIFKDDLEFTFKLKKYIKRILATELMKMQSPIVSFDNFETLVPVEEAKNILNNSLNKTSMYQSKWSRIVRSCIDQKIINSYGCFLQRTRFASGKY